MEQVPPRPGSWCLMTPDDDEFAKWGHSFSSSHGRGSLLSADLSTKVGQHWNGTKNHYSLGLLPHTSRSQVHKCTEVNRLHCSFPGLVSPPKPGCHPHTARAQWSHGQLSAAAQSHLGSRGVNTWTLALTPHTDNITHPPHHQHCIVQLPNIAHVCTRMLWLESSGDTSACWDQGWDTGTVTLDYQDLSYQEWRMVLKCNYVHSAERQGGWWR